MNAKIGIPILIVVVAAGAFFLGRQFQSAPPAEEPMAMAPPPEMPPPAMAEEPTPPPPPPQAATAPRRRAAPAAAPAEPEPAPVPAQPADTGVRRVEPKPEPAPAPEPVRIRLPEGTRINFTLNDPLSTKTNQTGDPFSGVVSRSVRVGETLVIPEGSVVRGTVGHVERPGRVKGRAELGLRFDQLELPDGQTYNLSASLTALGEGEKEEVTEEGQVKGEGSKKRDAATIGAGAGIGAVVGAIGGGGKGAATGGAIGAGAGTAVVLLTRGKDVELNRGTELAIQLDRPLSVAVK
jgi:hypothetical protein